MNGKERVYAAILRKNPDRAPRYIWVGEGAAQNLCKELGLNKNQLDALIGNDILQSWLSISGQLERPSEAGSSFIDEWGITWTKDGYYNMVINHPMSGMDEKAIAGYPLPDPYAPYRYDKLKTMISKYSRTHFIGADISGSLFDPACHLRGMEDFLMDMAAEAPEADVLLDRIAAFTTSVALESINLGVDWIWLGDDVGSQKSMTMGPDLWRKYFKTRMKNIIDAIKKVKPDMIIAYHSCGSIFPIIGDLAEIGVDVLNPLQSSAADMDHKKIAGMYGDKMTFMCGLDTQNFMVGASPDEVYSAMREELNIYDKKGGYIAAVSHTLQHDIPVKNIIAMLDALNS